MKLTIAIVTAMMCVFACNASANEPAQNYGLFQSEVEGVVVTRGKALEPERRVAEAQPAPRRTVALGVDYRGAVFGKHKILREGTLLYRDILLPMHRSAGD